MGEAAYAAGQEDDATAGDGGGDGAKAASDDETVVDAEFEEVDADNDGKANKKS